MTAFLETSLTLVTEAEAGPIDYRTFQDGDRHIIIHSQAVAEAVRELAMREGSLIKIPVGSAANSANVEFFAFDLQRDKHLIEALGRIFHLALIDAVHGAWRASTLSTKGFLGDEVTIQLESVAAVVDLRRFTVNACGQGSRKKKLTRLLFHHMANNANQGSSS